MFVAEGFYGFDQSFSEFDCLCVGTSEKVVERFWEEMTVWASWILPMLSAGFGLVVGGGQLVVYQFRKVIWCTCFVSLHCLLKPVPLDLVKCLLRPAVFCLKVFLKCGLGGFVTEVLVVC